MRAVGRQIGREMRALTNAAKWAPGHSASALTNWGPTINIQRDPRWGRNQETISEDPFVAGTYCELQYKCHPFSILSLENAEMMEDCP